MNKSNEKKNSGCCNNEQPNDTRNKTPKDCNNKK